MNSDAITPCRLKRQYRLQRIFGFKLENLKQSCRKNRRGAAVVEFALVAPIFFLLIFGMIEYGRLIMVQQILTNASREGARQAVLDGSTSSGVQSTVNTYLQNASVNGATVTVTPADLSTAAFGAPVTVEVKVTFNSVSWLPAPMFLSGRQMTAKSVMRRESVQ